MTTKNETKTESTTTPATNNNKVVFGPLGKYAFVAVIMVSIIVTTAIMLDRQLKTTNEQIATIEKEVADMYTAAADEANASELAATISTTVADTEMKQEAAIETVATVTTPAVTETATETGEAATTENMPVQKTAAAPVAIKAEQDTTATTAAAQFEMAKTESFIQDRQQQLAKENQARIEAYKQEQKKHMTKIFARIKALESQQLDRYKANQDGQIVRLRQQISQQQQMIKTLVLRNKELFKMRAANMQRNQNNREQVLNRI